MAAVRYTFTHKKYIEQHNETEYTEQDIRRIKLLGIPWHVIKDVAINGFREMVYRDLT